MEIDFETQQMLFTEKVASISGTEKNETEEAKLSQYQRTKEGTAVYEHVLQSFRPVNGIVWSCIIMNYINTVLHSAIAVIVTFRESSP